ncbi:MAG: DUF3332 domain-containing protein [Spirochaetia bacterium]|nr:DUF3332 domain-containing protein [Spirochaetia bacterium]
MKRKLTKLTLWLSAIAIMYGTMANCFGKFPLVRKIYELNELVGEKAGGGYLGRFISTVVMWVCLILPIYGIAGFLDILIFNLIEFWTGTPLFMKSGQTLGSNSSVLMVPVDANTLRMDVAGRESLYFLKDKPYQAFVIRNGQYVPVEGRLTESGYAEIVANNQVIVTGQFSQSEMIAVESHIRRERQLAAESTAKPGIEVAKLPAFAPSHL